MEIRPGNLELSEQGDLIRCCAYKESKDQSPFVGSCMAHRHLEDLLGWYSNIHPSLCISETCRFCAFIVVIYIVLFCVYQTLREESYRSC